MFFRRALSALALGAVLAEAAPALAEGKDAQAEKLADQAIQEDYLATRFPAAVKKLKKAIALCAKSSCSKSVEARLHRDLAVVYIAGQKKQKPGQQEMEKAIALDPEIQLDESLETPEVRQAFEAAGGKTPEPEPEPEPEPLEEEKPAPPPEPEEPAGLYRNWVSAGLFQDFLIYSSVDAACLTEAPDGTRYGSPDYRCFADGQFVDQPVYNGAGNEIRGGVGVATTRILLGYDRLFGDRWLAGARFGFAFGGGPTAPGSSGFMPIHLEARGAVYFGDTPFERQSLRPYAAVSLGFAQVAGRVPVDIFPDQAAYQAGESFTLDAWRRAGNGFAALGLGAAYPIGRSAINAELRFMQLVGSSGTAGSIGLGYAFGL